MAYQYISLLMIHFATNVHVQFDLYMLVFTRVGVRVGEGFLPGGCPVFQLMTIFIFFMLACKSFILVDILNDNVSSQAF